MPTYFTVPGKLKRGESVKNDKPEKPTASRKRKAKAVDEEELTSESEDEHASRRRKLDEEEDEEDDELKDESAADKRRRLALQFLETLKEGEEQDAIEAGFDAKDIDRMNLERRLKDSVGEEKGKIYRYLAEEFDFKNVVFTFFSADTKTTTGVAACFPYVYTISKDNHLIKWEIPNSTIITTTTSSSNSRSKKEPPAPRKPKQVAHIRGSRKSDTSYEGGHISDPICVAASTDGKFVTTGGKDNRIVVWDANSLAPLKIFKQHRAPICGLVFRRNTNQMYSASADRTVKVWSIDELAYIDTLFGHQDEIMDIDALASERCISVGARDRTARLWKIVDETQLIFRSGGGKPKKGKAPEGNDDEWFAEGSVDCVAMIDEQHFVTGSDNGSISLWSLNLKKPLFVVPVAHGKPPPLEATSYTAEKDPDLTPPPPQPRPITALAAIPYSDTFFSGSYDGYIRAWKISADKKRIEKAGVLGTENSLGKPQEGRIEAEPSSPGEKKKGAARGVVNGIAVFEYPHKSTTGISAITTNPTSSTLLKREKREEQQLYLAVALGKEMRLGRWLDLKNDGRNGALLIRIRRKKREEGLLLSASREKGSER